MQTSTNGQTDNIDKLARKLSIVKLPLNSPKNYRLDRSVDWVDEIFKEMNDGSDAMGMLSIELELTRKKSAELDEHIVINAKVVADVTRQCVRCLVDTMEHSEAEFECCCIEEEYKEDEVYAETETVLCDNKEMELYFMENRSIDLASIIHEQVFVNYNYYPLHDPNCLGLCPTTGKNLNYEEKTVH